MMSVYGGGSLTILGAESIGKHLLNALLNGACFCPYDARRDGLVELANWIREQRITFYYFFPTALRYFLNALIDSQVLTDLRLIELEGKPVYRTDVNWIKKHLIADCIVVNTLSSAETGTVSLFFLDMKTALDSDRVPAGYPVPGVKVLILGDSGQRLDMDQVGEVAVRSRFLAGGYWRKPDATNRNFSSESDDGSTAMYLTGDLGRVSQDGCLQLLGRKDFQAKIRSFRVYVTEVEAVLALHGEIGSAAVIGTTDPTGNTRLVAYVVFRNPPQAKPSALKSFLLDKLPDYMVPAEFVFLNEPPLMSTGKINRRALQQPSTRVQTPATNREPPRTPT